MKLLRVVFIIASLLLPQGDLKISKNLLCSQEFCDSAEECTEETEDCSPQNSTRSGEYILSPTFCNCCQYCLKYLQEDETCSPGGLGSPPTGNICGPGLYCTMTSSNIPKCLRMISQCHSEQDSYDQRRIAGTLGFLEQRPHCDERGDFGAVSCIPGQTCFCVSKKGAKIFGEVINEKSAFKDMNCGCARIADIAKNSIKSDFAHNVRCLSDGSYDELQCFGKRCFCVFRETGMISSNIIIDGTSQSLNKLPCYNESIHGNPNSYYKPCEKIKQEVMETIQKYRLEGFTYVGNPSPECEADGNFHRVQREGNRLICVDPTGQPIENFGTENLLENINCNCARTSYLLQLKPSAHIIPQCCQNGNWRSIQCRQNKCYCVNTINGHQQGLEVDIDRIETLQCHTADWQKC